MCFVRDTFEAAEKTKNLLIEVGYDDAEISKITIENEKL